MTTKDLVVPARARRGHLKTIYVFIASLLVAVGVLAAGPHATAKADPPEGLEATEILSDLNSPSNFAFDGQGRVYVAERYGIVRRYTPGEQSKTSTVVDLREEVFRQGDRGLLGLALDPKFDSGRPFIYLLYTYDKDPFGSDKMPRWGGKSANDACKIQDDVKDGCTASGRLVRYRVGDSGKADPSSKKVLLDGSTERYGGWCSQFTSHGTSTLVFGRDGMLYVGAGDGANFYKTDWGQFGGGTAPVNACNDKSPSAPDGRGQAPDKSDSKGGALRSQAVRAAGERDYVTWDGAILRINPDDGKAPRDNPLRGNKVYGDDRIVAYGLRNPYKFNFRPGTDELWLGDIGWGAKEEINKIRTGPDQGAVPNFGWPCYEGTNKEGSYPETGLCKDLDAKPTQSLGGVSSPLVKPYFEWTRDAPMAEGCKANGRAASSGGAFVTNSAWPRNLRGSYVFADMGQRCVAAMPIRNGKPDPTARKMILPDFRATAIQSGPGGNIYLLSAADGRLVKIAPSNQIGPNEKALSTQDDRPKKPVNPNEPPRIADVSTVEKDISRPGEGETYAIVETTIDNASAVDKVTVTLGESGSARTVDMRRKAGTDNVFRGYIPIDPMIEPGEHLTTVRLFDTAGKETEKSGPKVTLRG